MRRRGVSRSTFYVYYHDVYHLLKEITDEVFGIFDAIVGEYISGAKKSNKELAAMPQKIPQCAADNSGSLQYAHTYSQTGKNARQIADGNVGFCRICEFSGEVHPFSPVFSLVFIPKTEHNRI
jgi:AcrR family transcriptional regulator